MFATRYFPARYFAPRYFPKVGADPPGGALPWLYRSHTVTLGAGFHVGTL